MSELNMLPFLPCCGHPAGPPLDGCLCGCHCQLRIVEEELVGPCNCEWCEPP